jgi:hypothetical protein
MATYWPKLQPQLDGSKTAGEDCGPRAASTGVDWATEGAKVPTIADFRRRAGRPTGDTNTEQLTKALVSYDTRSETNGRTDIKAYRKVMQPKSVLRDAITGGKYAVVQMDYGELNDRRPDLTGDPRFRGMHSIGVVGQRVREGSVEWRVYDSLADGRRAGIEKGPDWWPRWLVETTAEGFTGRADTFTGVVINKTRKLDS